MSSQSGERPNADRIATLDLIRGIAILGILAVNIEGFAGPWAGAVSPDWNGPTSLSDHLSFGLTMLLFEGKMRALLSLLFGAGMILFIESAEAAGRNGDLLQMRRLGWLAVIGYLHYLFWWGDILFTYAIAGFAALLLRHLPGKAMVASALLIFTLWHANGMTSTAQPILAEISLNQAQHEGRARLSAEETEIKQQNAQTRADGLAEMRREAGSLPTLMRYKLAERADFPMIVALMTLCETLPLMLIGMALLRSGFFTGAWERRQLRLLAVAGIGIGGIATGGLVWFAAGQGFSPTITDAVIAWWAAFPHLAMGLGYAAALVLTARGQTSGWLPSRLAAVGRMALSNYLGCTLVMTALFYGWGFGLIGKVPEHWYWAFVLGGWTVMLLVSKPWLERFRQGPVEWLWRSLTQWQRLPFRR